MIIKKTSVQKRFTVCIEISENEIEAIENEKHKLDVDDLLNVKELIERVVEVVRGDS